MERTGEENENKIKNLENKYMPGNMDVEGHYRDIRTGDKELEEIEDKEQEAMKRKVRIYGCVEVQEPAIKTTKNPPQACPLAQAWYDDNHDSGREVGC